VSDGKPGDERLRSVLEQSLQLGFIGDPDLDAHIQHALGFATVAGGEPRHALDLGSGGGLPGLVLACHWTSSSWQLLDGSPKRTAFLAEAVAELGLDDRVTVVTGRAEDIGRLEVQRGSCDLVVARSFGPPAVLAECAAPFLEVGGRLIVSEPRRADARWNHPSELELLGLAADPAVVDGGVAGARYQVVRQVSPCPERYPRRVGIPAKRPLFGPTP
jgi:16S rRNA (guanine527-N7)-methyltransferase